MLAVEWRVDAGEGGNAGVVQSGSDGARCERGKDDVKAVERKDESSTERFYSANPTLPSP